MKNHDVRVLIFGMSREVAIKRRIRVFVITNRHDLERAAAQNRRFQFRKEPASDRKADQPSCRPYRATQTLIAAADQVIE
jgi:hypothetical protein